MKKYVISVIAAVVVVVGGILVLNGHQKTKTTDSSTKGSYVALGDSVAAGVGLKTDSDASACNRTDQSYPSQAAKTLNFKLKNLSCSGATLSAGILGQQNVNQLMVAPQLAQLFEQPKPGLVTLTIGANDANWNTTLAKCYTGECGTAEDTAGIAARLTTVSTNLHVALAQIQTHYGADMPQVIVTGYYQVFPTGTEACNDLKGIDATELEWGRQQQTAISNTVRDAVSGFDFAKFVPIDFSGHELCTADSWIQGLGDKQPYHPTEAGQAAIAKAVVTATKAK